jgi:hypothetical protein
MRRLVIALGLVVLLGACGNNKNNTTATSPSTPGGQIAGITITAVPVLVPAVSSATPGSQWQISWVLTLQETAGVAATLNEVDAVIDDVIIKFDASALTAQSSNGSNQLPAKGTLQLSQGITYTFQNGSKLATVVIVASLTDANGNRILKSTQIRIV